MSLKDDILVRFGADTTRLKKGMANVLSQAKNIGSKLSSAFGIGGGVAGAGSIAFVSELAAELDNLGKTASSLGISVERLSELEFAVGQNSQLDLGGLTLVMQKLTKNIGNAARSGGPLLKIFNDLGFEIKELEALSPDQAFLQIIDAVGNIDNQFRKGTVGAALFEDKWRQINLLANVGAAGLEESAEQIRAIGTATTESANAAALYNDQLDIMNRRLDAVKYEYGPGLISFFNELMSIVSGPSGASASVGLLTQKINLLYAQLALTQGTAGGVKQFFADIAQAVLYTEEELAQKEENIKDSIGNIIKARDQLKSAQQANESGARPAVVGKDNKAEKEKQKAAKKTTSIRGEETEKQISQTRSVVEAEGEYWTAVHDRINEFQENNAAGAEAAHQRIQQAIADMKSAGAEDFRIGYYESRELTTEKEATLPLRFAPKVTQEALDEMPLKIQESLSGFKFEISPEINLANFVGVTDQFRRMLEAALLEAMGPDGSQPTLDRTAAQEGHDES